MKYSMSADFLLVITAIIWGFAFVAQRMGMEHIGPFTFNAIRFAIGGLSLFPVIYFTTKNITIDPKAVPNKKLLKYSWIFVGIALFAGASLQQIGIVYTTAGNAGFITGLYVVLVPILGIFIGQRTKTNLWIGAILAVIGLYFLSVKAGFQISYGDLIVLLGAFFWAIHVHLISYFSPAMNALKLAQYQFFVCSALSFITAFIFESISFSNIYKAILPILYGGILSVGIAYTLQVIAQKKAHPAHASIILSTEAVFAVIGGWLILHENLTARSTFGCCIMMAGIIFAQINFSNNTFNKKHK